MNDTDARLWHPLLRINRVLRVMLHTSWSAEAWSVVRIEFSGRNRLAAERDPTRGVVQYRQLFGARHALVAKLKDILYK